MTTNEAQSLTGVERAMALDILDADGIDRLTEDEDGIFIPEPLFEDVPDYMYGFSAIVEAGTFWVTGEDF